MFLNLKRLADRSTYKYTPDALLGDLFTFKHCVSEIFSSPEYVLQWSAVRKCYPQLINACLCYAAVHFDVFIILFHV